VTVSIDDRLKETAEALLTSIKKAAVQGDSQCSADSDSRWPPSGGSKSDNALRPARDRIILFADSKSAFIK
jgi:hypothetical protein